MSLSHFWIVILVGVVVGTIGVYHNFCIKKVQGYYDAIHNPYIRTAIPFLMEGAFTMFLPLVLGGGSSLIMTLAESLPFQLLCLIFVIKFIFSITSFCSGVPGGIFLPLLVMGSLCGGILLITEMTGNFTHLLFLSLVVIIAYITADLLKGKPIYDQLLERMVKKMGVSYGDNARGGRI